jgi:hypothetical protein
MDEPGRDVGDMKKQMKSALDWLATHLRSKMSMTAQWRRCLIVWQYRCHVEATAEKRKLKRWKI